MRCDYEHCVSARMSGKVDLVNGSDGTLLTSTDDEGQVIRGRSAPRFN